MNNNNRSCLSLSLIAELLLLNVPLLVVRGYIALEYREHISVFLVKNILGILFGIVEIYDCCYDIGVVNAEEKKKKETPQTPNSQTANSLTSNSPTSNGNGVDHSSVDVELNKKEPEE